MAYSIYYNINRMIYFKKLEVDIETTIYQKIEIVDLLIIEKKGALNISTIPYIPEAQDESYQNKNEIMMNQQVDKSIV